MIFFFGTKAVQRELAAEQKVCPNCLSVTPHAVVEHDTRFTLYFIPLFSIKRDIQYTCTVCGDSHVIPYSEYAEAHPSSASVRAAANHAAPAAGRTAEPKSPREKVSVILEGKVVNGQVKTSNSRASQDIADQVLRWMWAVFIVLLLLAAAIITAIYFAAR